MMQPELMLNMKYLKTYKIFESLDTSLIKSIVSDVMNDFWESGEFEYDVFDIVGHEHEDWYRKHYRHDEFVVLSITPDDSMVLGRGFHTTYRFNDKWAKMIIFLCTHLEDYGYRCDIPTHVENGITKYASAKGYVNRVYREMGKGGPTGETFTGSFTIYITKK